MVRALDCRAKHRWFEPNPRIIVGMLAHCSPSSKWVPVGNTREVKGGEERNWPPYLTMPADQDKCLSNGHSPNVRNRTRDSPLLYYCVLDCLWSSQFDFSVMLQNYCILIFAPYSNDFRKTFLRDGRVIPRCRQMSVGVFLQCSVP